MLLRRIVKRGNVYARRECPSSVTFEQTKYSFVIHSNLASVDFT